MPWGIVAQAVGGLVGPIAGIFGANRQAQAAQSAANQISQAAGQAQDLATGIYGETKANLAPYISGGAGTIAALMQGLIGPGGGYNPSAPLLAPVTQQIGAPPSLETLPGIPSQAQLGAPPSPATLGAPPGMPGAKAQFQQSPGYAWQLGQGIDAIQNSAQGQTGGLSGNTLKALTTYGQGLANQDYYNWLDNATSNYWNTLNNAQNNYWKSYAALWDPYNAGVNQAQLRYGAGMQGYKTLADILTQNQAAQYQRLYQPSQLGATTAGAQGQLGQGLTGTIADLLLTGAEAQGAGNILAARYQTQGLGQAAPFLPGAINSIAGVFGAGGGTGAPSTNFPAWWGGTPATTANPYTALWGGAGFVPQPAATAP